MSSKLSERLERLTQWIDKAMLPDCQPEVQSILSEVYGMLRRVRRTRDPLLVARLESVVQALVKNPPNCEFAEGVLQDIKDELDEYSNFYKKMKHGHVPSSSLMIFGASSVFFLICLPAIMSELIDETNGINLERVLFDGFTLMQLYTVIVFGALGSIISILLRINDFEEHFDVGGRVVYFTGVIRPIIGAVFALIVFLIINSDLIGVPIDREGVKINSLGIIIAFISGFSERFAPAILLAAEGRLAPSPRGRRE